MGDFSSGFGTGYSIGSDIVAKKAIKKEKERSKKLIEDLQAQIEQYQLSDEPMTYADKLKLGVMVSQLGQTYSSTFNNINSAQSSYDQAKMVQEAQNLRNKNDNLMTIVKEMKDNKFLWEADLSKLDEITGLPISQIFNKDSINKIQNSDTRQAEINNIISAGKSIGKEYAKPLYEEKGIIPKGLEPTTAPTEPSVADKKFDMAMMIYEKNGNVDMLLKYLGMYITPEKKSALKEKLDEMDKLGVTTEEKKKFILGSAGGGGTTAPTAFKTLQTIKDSFKNVKTKAEYDEALASYNTSKEAKTSDWTPPPFKGQLTDLIKKVESAIWADYVNKNGKLKDKSEAEEYNARLQHYLKLIEEAKNAGLDVSQFQSFIPYKSLYGGIGNPLVTAESW